MNPPVPSPCPIFGLRTFLIYLKHTCSKVQLGDPRGLLYYKLSCLSDSGNIQKEHTFYNLDRFIELVGMNSSWDGLLLI